MFDYIVVFNHNIDKFQKEVITYLDNGYTVQGGITVGSTGMFAQALIKQKEPPTSPKTQPRVGATRKKRVAKKKVSAKKA